MQILRRNFKIIVLMQYIHFWNGVCVSFRQADGRKVLRSSIREFLCSEAVFALGIPTTRAGSLVTSDLHVLRDVFYDGRARRERCSVVLRIAPTFIRSVPVFVLIIFITDFRFVWGHRVHDPFPQN